MRKIINGIKAGLEEIEIALLLLSILFQFFFQFNFHDKFSESEGIL